MVELVDTLGLGSNLSRGPGSSPGIDIFKFNIKDLIQKKK